MSMSKPRSRCGHRSGAGTLRSLYGRGSARHSETIGLGRWSSGPEIHDNPMVKWLGHFSHFHYDNSLRIGNIMKHHEIKTALQRDMLYRTVTSFGCFFPFFQLSLTKESWANHGLGESEQHLAMIRRLCLLRADVHAEGPHGNALQLATAQGFHRVEQVGDFFRKLGVEKVGFPVSSYGIDNQEAI